MNIRTIKPTDNIAIAAIIRKSLKSHGLDIPGTVYTDPTTDDLFALFRNPDSVYFIAEENGVVIGGCGIYPTNGLPSRYVELVKLYLTNSAKGKGYGRELMEKSLSWAKSKGATHVYLETFNELASAVSLYQKLGFLPLDRPLGESGHHACEIWMLKTL